LQFEYSTESLQNRSTILPLFIGPMPLPQYGTLARYLARYQVILLGEQRHIRCEQLAQGCCPNNAAAEVEPSTSRSQVRRPTTTLPSHICHGLRHLYINVTKHRDKCKTDLNLITEVLKADLPLSVCAYTTSTDHLTSAQHSYTHICHGHCRTISDSKSSEADNVFSHTNAL